MNPKPWFVLAAVCTAAALALWIATDRHAYTKFEVVERVEVPVPEDDLLAGTGFYEGGVQVSTERRKEFHLGLLPTPAGLVDKHWLSVPTLAVPPWVVAMVLMFAQRRRRRRRRAARSPSQQGG